MNNVYLKEPSEHEEDNDLPIEEVLKNKIEEKNEAISKVLDGIQNLMAVKEASMTMEEMLEEKSQQFENCQELIERNLAGSNKIEVLFDKIRRSRSKIDQILSDLLTYQKEFETIQVNK